MAPTARAGRVRSLVDDWVRRIPLRARRELVGRLRDEDSEAARGAFYELAIGEVLRTLGSVRYEPEDLPCDGRPDWVVTRGKRRVVVEVATLEEAATTDEKRRKTILCKVAELSGPWWVMIDWRRSVDIESARPGSVKRAVASALASLTGRLPQDLIAPLGRRAIALRVHRKTTSAGSIVGSDATRSVRINPGEEAIKERIGKKAKRYRGLKRAGIPFVVALCTDDFLVDDGNFFRALFGREQITVTWSDSKTSPEVAPTGLDASGLLTPGSSGVYATTVSEVWFVRRVGIRGRLALRITRAPNPWAANPAHWHPRRMAVIGHRQLTRETRFKVPRRSYRIPMDTRPRVGGSAKKT